MGRAPEGRACVCGRWSNPDRTGRGTIYQDTETEEDLSMADNTSDYKDVIAIVVKVTRPDADDKTKVTVKSLNTGTWVSVTIWDNSHPSAVTNPPKKGDLILVSGKLKQNKGDDGTIYNNL